jgi:nitroreductase
MMDRLATRRSASAPLLAAPGPDEAELQALLQIAARAPDHGKLFPWRFIVLRGAAKGVFTAALRDLAALQPDPDKARAALRKLEAPPVAVVVVSSPQPGTIPAWEQQLSAGAVCTLLLLAAQGMGYGANWITDWYSYDGAVADRLGLASPERVAGFVYLGTSTEPPLERVRPDVAALTTIWGN